MLYSFPFIYRIFSYFPIIFVLGRKVSLTGFIVSFSLLFLLIINGAFDRFILYFPIIFLLIFSVTFRKYEFSTTIKKITPFYIASILYGIFQKLFGYTNFELGWINSGLSYIGVENYFLGENIRPFSFFAGINEFAIFVSIFSYYFFVNKKFVQFFLSILFLILIGSRGVLLATLISLFVIHSSSGHKLQRDTFRIILYSFLIYLFIAVLYPIYIQDFLTRITGENSRLIVYGTFNARLVAAKILISDFSIKNIFLGLNLEPELFAANLHIDNFYLRLINDLGLFVALLVVIILIKNVKNRNQLFSLGMLLSYGFYNDVIPSFYLMFNLALVYFSIPGTGQSKKKTLV